MHKAKAGLREHLNMVGRERVKLAALLRENLDKLERMTSMESSSKSEEEGLLREKVLQDGIKTRTSHAQYRVWQGGP